MKRSTLYRIGSITVTVLVVAFMSACVSAEVESTYNDDGSVSHTYELTVDRSQLEQFVDVPFDLSELVNQQEVRDRAEAAGLEYEAIDTGNIVGSRVSKDYPASENASADLNAMITSLGLAPEQNIEVFSGGVTRDGDIWELELTVDTQGIVAQLLAGQQLDDLPAFADGAVSITYTATLPGEIQETNGSRLDENTVSWNLPLQGSTTLTATADAGSSDNTLATILVIAIVIALLLAALAAAWFLFMRRSRPQPALAAPTPIAPPPRHDPDAETRQLPRVQGDDEGT